MIYASVGIYLLEHINHVRTRDVKSCQIRHPEIRIRYPATSEGSHRIYETMFAWYMLDHIVATQTIL